MYPTAGRNIANKIKRGGVTPDGRGDGANWKGVLLRSEDARGGDDDGMYVHVKEEQEVKEKNEAGGTMMIDGVRY